MINIRRALLAALLIAPAAFSQGKRGGANNPFPGGANPDGSLRPTPPVTRLWTQDAYTEYAILAPGSESFRIRFLPEESRVGATELVNATRGGSEGSDVEVFDPRTGQPLKFTYGPQPQRLSTRRASPARFLFHLVERRRPAQHHRRRPPQTRLRQPQRPKQSR